MATRLWPPMDTVACPAFDELGKIASFSLHMGNCIFCLNRLLASAPPAEPHPHPGCEATYASVASRANAILSPGRERTLRRRRGHADYTLWTQGGARGGAGGRPACGAGEGGRERERSRAHGAVCAMRGLRCALLRPRAYDRARRRTCPLTSAPFPRLCPPTRSSSFSHLPPFSCRGLVRPFPFALVVSLCFRSLSVRSWLWCAACVRPWPSCFP